MYLRLKDQLFEGWVRPYNTEQLERFIKTELGATTTMGDHEAPKLLVTTVNAEHVPTELHVFRSYQLPCDEATNRQLGYSNPKGEGTVVRSAYCRHDAVARAALLVGGAHLLPVDRRLRRRRPHGEQSVVGAADERRRVQHGR